MKTSATLPLQKSKWPLSADLLLAFLLLLLVPGIAWYWLHGHRSNYYSSPLRIPVSLAANFGELRPDHFHMGLDIRTKGKENLPVYAAAAGYISHITIEEKGFGRAIYITHPNQTMTIYAHLNDFDDDLEKAVRNKQYKEEKWEQDIRFDSTLFPVQKGQFIAWSGNTGASEAPHLHFEVRDLRTGNNLDPGIAGLSMEDDLPPVINNLYWYDRQHSSYLSAPHPIPIESINNTYSTKSRTVQVSSPVISFGIRARDKYPDSRAVLGIAGADLWLDGDLVHSFNLSNISYNDSRYINSCIDYGKWIRSNTFIRHLSTLPGNRLPAFCANPGIIHLSDKHPHTVKVCVSDASGNTSTVQFQVQYDGSPVAQRRAPTDATIMVPGRSARISTGEVQLEFSRNAWYDTVAFQVRQSNRGKISGRVQLHDTAIPVHDSFSVSLKSSLAMNDPLRARTVMQLTGANYKEVVKGEWHGQWMMARWNRLGMVELLTDINPPHIKSIGWKDGEPVSTSQQILQVACTDDLPGIGEFRAMLDGRWLLFSRKGGLFTYQFDQHCPKGKHQLAITVKDLAGNTATRNFTLQVD